MRNLVAFFLKHQFFSLFLILEMIALAMLSNSFSYPRMLRFNAASDISGTLFADYHAITGYFRLREENKSLLRENSRLYNMLLAEMLTADSNRRGSRDSSYVYIPATVLRNTVNRSNNFIVLNKGKEDGIEKEMGIVSDRGIAGIIIGVSKHYAVALSLLNTHAHISARIKKNHQLVNVIWDEQHDTNGEVVDIPAHVSLQKGDTIVTSGNSFIFPAGLNIGVIDRFEKSPNNSLNKADLKFSTDFNSLLYVYILQNVHKKEQIKLLEEAEDE